MQSQAFFSTTFFTFGDDGWKASNRVWIYWAVTIPSTILVLIIWGLWLYGPVLAYFISHSWKKLPKRTPRVEPKEKGQV